MTDFVSAAVAALRWPTSVAGISLPHNRFTHMAIDLVRECSPVHLINHAARTYFFGHLLGVNAGLEIDEEMFFLACILHDIGLTERFVGHLPFEIQGAQAARHALLRAGYPALRTDTVWDGIAMHTLSLADFKRPEIRLVSSGAGADVAGIDMDKISREQTAEILTTFPRLNFKKEFVKVCASVASRFPSGANRSFMRDIAERMVPGFHSPNICDRIVAAPFDE